MNRFDFYSVPRIVFGRGQFARIGELAAGLGNSALVVTNLGEVEGGRLVQRLEGLLREAGMPMVIAHQRGEPTAFDVDNAADLARRQGCRVVIGLGGGSAIDAAKAAAGLVTSGGSALDYMEVVGAGRKLAHPAAPWIAVPTTAGTGAEATRNAVVASPQNHFKASIRGEHLLARVALVDPELAVSAPPEVTAATGMDALCQLIESYTSTGAQPMTDALAMEGISHAARCLPRAYRDGGDLDAREGMALAALLSGITLANAGLGAVHGLAAPLGGNIAAPHGAICAALLPHVIAANVRALREENPNHPALSRYAAVGRVLAENGEAGATAALPSTRADSRKPTAANSAAVAPKPAPEIGEIGDTTLFPAGNRVASPISASPISDEGAVEACIEFVRRLAGELHIAPLGSFGLTREAIPQIVTLARRSSSMKYNPVTLSADALADVLAKAM